MQLIQDVLLIIQCHWIAIQDVMLLVFWRPKHRRTDGGFSPKQLSLNAPPSSVPICKYPVKMRCQDNNSENPVDSIIPSRLLLDSSSSISNWRTFSPIVWRWSEFICLVSLGVFAFREQPLSCIAFDLLTYLFQSWNGSLNFCLAGLLSDI